MATAGRSGPPHVLELMPRVPPAISHEPGATVGPNLRLVRLLARGGMGSVWVAEHLALKTQVAVKFIADDAARDPMIMARFEREAMAAAQLRSPHVVQIFDHGRSNEGISYIAMELLDGETLGKRLGRSGSLSLRETAVVVGHVCRALSKAHASGIVHRDIKPDNIFLTDSDGELFVKVLDFGIAKRSTDQPLGVTSTGMAVGTPHYMSPEQSVSAKDVNFSTDLWAIAAVAYRCLTGQVPFKADTFGGLCVAINRGQFTAPSTIRGDLPPSLDAWFVRALALSPDDRFGSARELAAQFSRAAGFPAGVLVSVPSSFPGRSVTASPAAALVLPAEPAAARIAIPRLPSRAVLSSATVTVFPSDPRAVSPDAATVLRSDFPAATSADRSNAQTGPSIAAASLNRRRSDDGRSRGGAFRWSAIAVLTAATVLAAVFIRPNEPFASRHASTDVVLAGDAVTAAPATSPPETSEEREKSAPDLGASSGATAPAATAPVATAPAESADAPSTFTDIGPVGEPAAENQRKPRLVAPPVASGARACKGQGKPRVHPMTTSEPEKDLMEP